MCFKFLETIASIIPYAYRPIFCLSEYLIYIRCFSDNNSFFCCKKKGSVILRIWPNFLFRVIELWQWQARSHCCITSLWLKLAHTMFFTDKLLDGKVWFLSDQKLAHTIRFSHFLSTKYQSMWAGHYIHIIFTLKWAFNFKI